ncbi:MAG: hypothetical protein P8J27_13650, partial [Mariniblastus sp.]|nr:hypothetical protein [Mariniblastus sp.]
AQAHSTLIVLLAFVICSNVGAQEFGAVIAQPTMLEEVADNSDCIAESSRVGLIEFDTSYTSKMLDFQNRQGDKEVMLLKRAAQQQIGMAFTFGTQFRASGLFAATNTADKFPYQGRFPTDFSGESASDLRLLQANQNITVDVSPMVHGYFETLFSDVFTFSAPKQGSFQVRQAYVVFGDLSRSPFYAHIGKKNVSFGDMGTLSPFTQAMPWHYFAPLAEGAGVGFDNGWFNATVTALSGSRGIRVVDSEKSGSINNFAANLQCTLPVGICSQLRFGGGYLLGTIYNADVPEHTDPGIVGPNNGAWDVNAALDLGELHFAGEFAKTANPWPATDFAVTAYSAEAAVDNVLFGRPGRASVSWSEGIQGEEGTQFEFNRQLVLGYRHEAFNNATFTFEYVRSTGFAPLMNIQTASDISVEQDSFVFGAVITL